MKLLIHLSMTAHLLYRDELSDISGINNLIFYVITISVSFSTTTIVEDASGQLVGQIDTNHIP